MKVLLTGAAGFLGSWFLEYLVAEGGHEVWSVDIRQHPTGVPIDVEDLETWLSTFDENVDLVLHFAAPVGGRMKIERDPMYNADAFRLDSVMFRWAVSHAKVVVYPSSSAVYPTSLQKRPSPQGLFEHFIDVRAEAFGSPDELYGFSKLAGEMMAWKAYEKHGLSTLCIRPFSGYGPGQTDDYPVPALLRRVIARKQFQTVWGDGFQVRDFVYVTDIVSATMARIEDGFTGFETMNIASGLPIDFRTVLEIACQLEDLPFDPIMDLEKPEGVRYRVGDPGRMDRWYHRSKLIPLRDGLENTLRWMKEPAPIQVPEPITVEASVGK